MISAAWISAAVFALPQTIVFRELTHPNIPSFKQCTTIGFFENFFLRSISKNETASDTDVTNETIIQYNASDPALYTISPTTAENLYSSLFLFAVYMLPLSVIIVTYGNILNKLYRKPSINRQFPDAHNHHGNTTHITTSAERPPTCLIRCLTLFRSTVKQERLQRGNASENINDGITVRRKSLESFDTVIRVTDRTGENPRTLLSTDDSCNNLTNQENVASLNHSQRRTTKQDEHNGKKKTSFDLSHLEPKGVNEEPEEGNKIKCASHASLTTNQITRTQSTPSSSSFPSSIRKNRSVRCGASKPNSSNLVALRMCAIQVLAFIVCWTPYVSMSLWHIIGKCTMWKRIMY